MNASWYDLLDVAPDATEDAIKAAWKSSIADLDPTDRKFRVYNQAAEVLLDPGRRAEYDAELDAAALVEVVDEPVPAGPEPVTPGRAAPSPAEPMPGATTGATAASGGIPGWLLVVVAGLTAAVLGACAWVWLEHPSDDALAESTRAAQSSAERAVVPILSYDAANLEESKAAAQSYLTSDYRKDYDQLFAGIIEQNAPATKTVVQAEFLRSAIVRSGEDRVQVLVLVNQSRTNKAESEPVVYKNYVTLTMERVDGEWLVADMDT